MGKTHQLSDVQHDASLMWCASIEPIHLKHLFYDSSGSYWNDWSKLASPNIPVQFNKLFAQAKALSLNMCTLCLSKINLLRLHYSEFQLGHIEYMQFNNA